MSARYRIRGGMLLIACAVIVSGLVLAPGTALADETHDDRVVVEVNDDGSAEMAVVLTYDLSDEQDADGFASVAADEEVQEDMRERFEDRMTLVAEEMDEAVEREVSVSDAEIEVTEHGDAEVGIVELRISWSNFAAVDGTALAVTEPFASGFDVDVELHLMFPDEYDVSDADPSPTDTDDQRLVWPANQDLDGFALLLETDAAHDDAEAVEDDQVQATEDVPADDEADDGLAGFGVIAGIVALGVLALRSRTAR